MSLSKVCLYLPHGPPYLLLPGDCAAQYEKLRCPSSVHFLALTQHSTSSRWLCVPPDLKFNGFFIQSSLFPTVPTILFLGWDFLSSHQAVIDCSREAVSFSSRADAISHDISPPTAQLALTENIHIPQHACLLEPVSCSIVSDATVLFSLSTAYVHRHLSLLPIALLAHQACLTRVPAHNQFPFAITFCGESLSTVEPYEPLTTLVHSEESPDTSAISCSPVTAASPDDVFSDAIDTALDPQQCRDVLSPRQILACL